ncbi:MAG TPA: hypothetical protein PKI32_02760 [Opitutales bacterium]|nr:hypothetical protein [Opitutales bacterium]
MDATKEFKRWHVNTEEANQLAGWLRRNGIESNADLVESLIEERDAYLDEVQRTNENEARIMADLLATREERDRLRSELAARPVAVSVEEWEDTCREISAWRDATKANERTKALHIGEYRISLSVADEDGEESGWDVTVPWATVKEIMTAIRCDKSRLCALRSNEGES